jgi:hypothetical protein
MYLEAIPCALGVMETDENPGSQGIDVPSRERLKDDIYKLICHPEPFAVILNEAK